MTVVSRHLARDYAPDHRMPRSIGANRGETFDRAARA
jgi:hypothetical protein